ncbi:LytTR family DNA-binding domain-containing protein [Niallia sp. NCCP-28]|uniref:LytR/AlgR family response regulator transcription factor n=1 Tax=Niallia sp. NCCP-28 TaxID=2934712 RepID=UPI00208260AD|nr:LytTR family DNA-binding domain-containing protein [Niallia sp. NCCP-28]GKU83141.1 sensory transduction protein LytT [Niallia sp. NCCP-28]
MLKALVVEDEPLARDELMYLLKRTDTVEIMGEYASVEDELEFLLSAETVDVIFLDIQLGNESGMRLAEKISMLKNPPEIVFATAYDEYALHAFKVHAMDYLLKPIDEERLKSTIKKLQHVQTAKHYKNKTAELNTVSLMPDKIAVSSDDRIKIIPIEEILYIQSQNNKTSITTKTKTITVTSTLIQLEQKLKNSSMFRVHRSFLVNMDKIKEIEPWFHSTYQLFMEDGAKIPVSRNYTKDLKQILQF